MSIVFGPINSRRFGMSLGIDLSPSKKSCNFDCVYCELKGAKTTDKIENPVSVDEILTEVKAALKKHQNIDVITLTANGEPSLYPNLKELIFELNRIKTTQKLLILSNGTAVLDEIKFQSLLDLDIVKFSLDSANQKTFNKIDRNAKISVNNIIKKMIKFRQAFKGELVLEILIVSGFNDTKDAMLALNQAIKHIRPDRVDISTIDRPPAYNVKPVSNELLGQLSTFITNAPVFIASKKQSTQKYDFSQDDIKQLLARRPQSTQNVDENFSDISRANLKILLDKNEVKCVNLAGVSFFKLV
ncbi:radical SAM protein [Campylobacter majalis]|uniref:radical SAM protein n=1 Tax=Campylobacter majalis TaxID=2790656 RepID=UPI003D681135